MISTRSLFLAAAAFGIASSAFSQSAAGSWKGHPTNIPDPVLPATMNGAQRQQIKAQMAQLRSVVILMNLKSDKTYTILTQGGPKMVNNRPEKGNWSQTGQAVTITLPGKTKSGAAATVTGTLIKDGKQLEITVQGSTYEFVRG